MSPDEQQNTPTNPNSEQGATPTVQPGAMYEPNNQPPQSSNPFANQPFLNQPVPGQPITPSAAGVSSASSPQTPEDDLRKRVARAKTNRRLWIILSVLSVLLIFAGIAYLFLVYIPELPQNVWNTGLNRSGKAMNTIISHISEQDSLEALKKSEVTATLAATKGQSTYTGDATITRDGTNTKGDLKITQKTNGLADKVFTTAFVTQPNDKAQFPNLYLQFTGLKTLGVSDILPGLLSYENKWIVIDDAYIKSLGVTPEQLKADKDQQITPADLSVAGQQVISTSTDYMLTTNPQKAVFEQRKFVGQEKVDGKATYHYIVGINKQHAKDYCASLVNNLSQTQMYKKFTSKEGSTSKETYTKECQDYVESNIQTNDTFDMWIDAHYKLIYRLRFTDKEDKNSYRDIGQSYHGGSSFSFFTTTHNGTKRTDTAVVIETDFKTHNLKGAVSASSQGSSPYMLKVVWQAKPYTGELKIDKPANVVPVQDVFKTIGIDPTALGKTGAKNAFDTERQADIRALSAHVEDYFNVNHRYPTFANLNDAKWLKSNMPGLDVAALKDPENSSSLLVATPTAKTYAYQPKAQDNSACDNVKKDCTSYTLIATLSDGTIYVKQSLN